MEIDKKTLRYRFLVPLYLAQVAEGICLTIIMFFVPLYVRRTFAGTSLLTISSIVAIPAGAMFIASNLWGALADYTRRLKPFLLIGLAGYAGCLFALSSSNSTFSVVLISAVSSLFFAAHRPISQSYVTLLRESEKGRAIGDLMAFQSVGWFIGGIACGYLFEPLVGIPVGSILIGGSIFALVVLVVVALVLGPMQRTLAVEADPSKKSLFSGLVSDLKWLYGSKALATACILTWISASGIWLFFGNFSVFMTEHIGASTTVLGWAMALSTLFGVFAFGPSGRLVDRAGPVRILAASVFLYALIYGLASLTTSPVLVSIYFCIPVYPAFNVSVVTLVSEITGESRRAGGLGILGGIFAFSLATGTLAGGAIADYSSLGVLPRWTAGMQLACLAGIFTSVKLLKALSIDSGRRSLSQNIHLVAGG